MLNTSDQTARIWITNYRNYHNSSSLRSVTSLRFLPTILTRQERKSHAETNTGDSGKKNCRPRLDLLSRSRQTGPAEACEESFSLFRARRLSRTSLAHLFQIRASRINSRRRGQHPHAHFARYPPAHGTCVTFNSHAHDAQRQQVRVVRSSKDFLQVLAVFVNCLHVSAGSFFLKRACFQSLKNTLSSNIFVVLHGRIDFMLLIKEYVDEKRFDNTFYTMMSEVRNFVLKFINETAVSGRKCTV